jgi:hypothetical protein
MSNLFKKTQELNFIWKIIHTVMKAGGLVPVGFYSASSLKQQSVQNIWGLNTIFYFYFKSDLDGFFSVKTRVITKLPKSEQSSKGKVKTHRYINRQNQSTTGKL